MLSYDEEYDGYQVAKEIGAEDANCGWADQAGQTAQESQYRADCRTRHLAIGIYLRVLYALQLDDDILLLAKEDVIGKALQDLSLKKRERASKKE